jgi:probable HAF family extracellular repeat protein
MKIARYSLLLLLALLLAGAPASGAARYTVTEIVLPEGTEVRDPYGSDIFYLDINDNGVVAGWSYIQGTTYEFGIYRWENGVLTVLPPHLPGDDNTRTRAFAINNPGQIAGCSGTEYTRNACLWPGAAPFTPATLPDGGIIARGLNDLGQVVGTAGINSDTPVLWKDGVRTTLPGLTVSGSYGEAYGINENGRIVGFSHDYPIYWPVFWPDSSTITNLGDFGGIPDIPEQRGGKAFAINDRNQVVGYAHAPIPPFGGWRAFLWEDGAGLTDLGCLKTEYYYGSNSRALDINNAGQIVGWSDAYPEGGQSFGNKAVLWEKGVIIDLNTRIDPIPGYYLREAQAINNQGQIVCLAQELTSFNRRIYLLTPVSSPAAINLLLLND